ncbi:MAG: peptidylprolyl isomerase [Rhodoferax sp.]|nr:peptidylprolyl isomerase [Rhodoferax sp.]
MNFRIWVLVTGLAGLLCGLGITRTGMAAQSAQPADHIVAVVNYEPITHAEVRLAVQRMTKALTQRRQPIPPVEELQRRELDRLIDERAQLQLAREMGLRVEEVAVDQAEQTVARQNKMDPAGLYAFLAKDGVSREQFRNQLREQLLLSRLHEREVEARIRITDTDIDNYLADQQTNTSSSDPAAQEINLAHILIAIPEKAVFAQIIGRQETAQRVLERIRAGEDFGALAQEFSAADSANGGQMGLRRVDRYPEAFVRATEKLGVGGVSDLVRSAAGFHILKVIEKSMQLVKTVVQNRARHILLLTDATQPQAAAIARLADYRQRILAGKATFANLARAHSQDGSAARGGDLGWTAPGSFVPEFEEALNRLEEGQISPPVASRFGVHLIELLERRRVELGPRELREAARRQLHDSRFEETFTTWAQEVRARAFVELREPPQ